MAVVCGVTFILCNSSSKRKKEMVESLYRIPIIVPHIVSVLLVYNILSQSGILPRILYEAGLITDQSQFPSILYERNGIGVIIAYLWKEIPFVALTTYTILSKVSSKPIRCLAGNLGANKRQIFFLYTSPSYYAFCLSSFYYLSLHFPLSI